MHRFRSVGILQAAAILASALSHPATGMAPPDGIDPKLAELIQAMNDPEPTVRRPAAFAIAHQIADPKPALSAMIVALEGADEHMRRSALLAIARIGPDAERAIPAVTRLLNDEYEDVAVSAIRSLQAIGTAAVPALAKALSHDNPVIAQAAAYALGAMGRVAASTAPALLEATKCEDRDVSKSALRALPYLGPQGVATLASLLDSDAPSQLKSDAAFALQLAPVDLTAAIPALARVAVDGDIAGAYAIEALKKVGRHASAQLVAMVERGSEPERRGAILILGELGPAASQAAPRLLAIATDVSNDVELRRDAVRALGRIAAGNRDPVPKLIEMLSEADLFLREETISALGHIGPVAIGALPALLDRLDVETRPHMRLTIVEAIGRLGPAAAEGVPALRKALRDEDPHVRRTAVAALGRIGPNANVATGDLLELIPLEDPAERGGIAQSLGQILVKSETPPPQLPQQQRGSFQQGRQELERLRRQIQITAAQDRVTERQRSLHTKEGRLGLAGIVTDPAGQPLTHARVTLRPFYGTGQARAELGGGEDQECDDVGTFLFTDPPFREGKLAVIAAGYVPHQQNVETDKRSQPIIVKLEKGKSITVVLVDPDGNPVEGAEVGVRGGGLEPVLRVKTDAQGRFTVQAGLTPTGVIIKHPDFMTHHQGIPSANDVKNTITLRRPFHITGTVTDAVTGERIPEFAIRVGVVMGNHPFFPEDEEGVPPHHGVAGSYDWKADTAFRPTDIAPSRVLVAEAPGYVRAVSHPFLDKDGDQVIDFALERASASAGVLRFPDGRPVVGAEVFLSRKSDMFRLQLVNGRLNPDMHRGPQTKTDAQGRFTFETQKEPFVIVAQHEEGLAIVRDNELSQSGQITMQPWARVVGRLFIEGEAAAGEEIVLSIDRGDATSRTAPAFPGAEFTLARTKPDRQIVGFQYRTKTGADGRFAFDRVKPGKLSVERQVSLGGMYVGITHTAAGQAEPNQTLELRLERIGRAVTGRVELPDSEEEWRPCQTNGSANLISIDPPAEGTQYHPFALQRDGSFRAVDIPPGTYDLEMDIFCNEGLYTGTPLGVVKETVVVPPITEGDKTTVDLGTLRLIRVNTLAPSDSAPVLRMVDLNETQTTLAEVRGKLVLLHFTKIGWDRWAMETGVLQSLYEQYRADDRFVMISVYLETDMDRVRRFVSERKLPWGQFVVTDDLAAVYRAYGLHRRVNLFLLNADGTIRQMITGVRDAPKAIEAALASP